MLKGRLGLETARVPQADRHGLMWLGRGNLYVEDGTLRFATAGFGNLEAGDYAIPFQLLSCVLLQPGTTVSHDALRLMSRHGTGLVAVGEEGVRYCASMPQGPDSSARARRQARAWANETERLYIARRMYAWRLGELFPNASIEVLRGMEGARMKQTYQRLAEQYGLTWAGRRYDRERPEEADPSNQAINHAASAVQGAALVAVAVTGAVPQLGFIHEDSGISFALDIADLFRDTVTLPAAFGAVKEHRKRPADTIERVTRKMTGQAMRRQGVVGAMIDKIKELFDGDDSGGDS